MDASDILAANAAILAACVAALWLLSIRLRDVSFIDAWWGGGIALLAWTTLAMSGQAGPHAIALTALATLWGLRLALHLLWRWRVRGPDPRYAYLIGKVRSERGWSFGQASLRAVFALQAPIQFLVALPVQLGQAASPQPFRLLAWAGVAVALVGLAIEALADLQLTRFRADPANDRRVLDTGLWSYSRHPNYFGEACVWWGLFLIAADTGDLGVAAIASPILLTFLLTRWSGVPILEARMLRRRPDYEAYARRTSSFIPMPPKRG